MDGCLLNQAGDMLVHQQMKASPDPWLSTSAPSRDDLVVAVAWLCTWSWLADLCAQQGIPFVLGHALSMNAIHGGTAKTDTSEAQTIAVRLRGGMLPPADVSPADMRATRDLLRRWMHGMRQRAALLTHVQHTHRPYNLPELGRKLADTTTRDGVAERCADPAGQQSIDVELALMGRDARRRRDVERSILNAATQQNATTRDLLRTVPGIGAMLRLVLRYEIHASQRFPRVQAFVSSGRLVTCANASAGTRDSTSGTKIGHASRTGVFAEAAVLCLRANPAGQTDLGRLEHTHGQGTAWTVWAHTLARAVYDLLKRDTAFAMHQCRTSERERSGRAWRLTGHRRETPGTHALAVLSHGVKERVCAGRRDSPEPLALIGRSRRRFCRRRGRIRMTCAAPCIFIP
jgi:transposase